MDEPVRTLSRCYRVQATLEVELVVDAANHAAAANYVRNQISQTDPDGVSLCEVRSITATPLQRSMVRRDPDNGEPLGWVHEANGDGRPLTDYL